MRARTPLAAAVLAALAGCASCDSVPSTAVTDCELQVVPGGAAADLLFVIDDSGSMSDKQQALADNLSAFIDALVDSPVALDLNVGVTNTSVDAYPLNVTDTTGYPIAPNGNGYIATTYLSIRNGADTGFPGARATPFPAGTFVAIEQDPGGVGSSAHFAWGTAYDPAGLVSTWGGPRILSSATSTKAQLARDFKANVLQGDWGSGKEQPLRAMRASLDASLVTTGANFGFLRAGARLTVVILTDEDDCSESGTPKQVTSDTICRNTSNPVDWAPFDSLDGLVTYLDSTVGALSGQPPIVAAIAGFSAAGAATGCTGSGFSSSANPRRIGAFLDRLEAAHPDRTKKVTLCQPFANALLSIASIVIPQTMPLMQSPADYRMMVVSVQRPSGTVGCPMAAAGTSQATDPATGVVYTPAPPGGLPSLTFQNACLLGVGDKVNIGIVCVR